MLTPKHVIWMALCAVFVVIMSIIAVKKKFSLRLAGSIMTGIALVSEISKMMTEMVDKGEDGAALNPGALPFHLCSLMVFIVPYITFAKESAFKQHVIDFVAVMGTLGSFCAILIPTNGVEFNTIGAYQCFVYHAGLMWFSLYLILSRKARLNWKVMFTNMGALTLLAFMMIYVNGALTSYGTNFMFVVRPPMSGLPILNLDHGWYVYFVTLLAVGVLLITLFYLPFVLTKWDSKGKKIEETEKV